MLSDRIQKYKDIEKGPTRFLKKLEKDGNILFYYPNMVGICKNSHSSILNCIEYKTIEISDECTIVEIKKFKTPIE